MYLLDIWLNAALVLKLTKTLPTVAALPLCNQWIWK